MWVHHPEDSQPNANKCGYCESEVLGGDREPNPHTDEKLGDPHVQIVMNEGELYCWCDHTVHMPGCTAYVDGYCVCTAFFEQTGSVVAPAR